MPIKYVVIELQTNGDGSVANITTAYDTRNAAESAYHTILAAAAISALPMHAAALLSSDGTLIDSYCYEHEVQA